TGFPAEPQPSDEANLKDGGGGAIRILAHPLWCSEVTTTARSGHRKEPAGMERYDRRDVVDDSPMTQQSGYEPMGRQPYPPREREEIPQRVREVAGKAQEKAAGSIESAAH